MQPPEYRLRGVPRAMLWVASVALAAMMLVVVADVILRAVLNTPVRGAYDLVSYGLLIMVFFGIAPVVARQGEILIDLIDAFVPNRVLRALKLATGIGTLALFLFLGWSMIGPAQDAWRWGGYSLELGLPVWTLWAIAFVGLAGILWTSVIRLRRILAGRDGDGPGAADAEEGGL